MIGPARSFCAALEHHAKNCPLDSTRTLSSIQLSSSCAPFVKSPLQRGCTSGNLTLVEGAALDVQGRRRRMPIDKRVNSAAEALADVSDGATVLISGFGGAGFPNMLIRALCDRGAKNLTLVANSATHRYSLTHELIEAGLVRKIVCSAARGHNVEPSPFERLWVAAKIDLECVPQGTFAERIRAGGAGIAAFYTPVGFGTELARGKEVRCFNGHEHVLEQAIKGDLALVRADTADRYGNLTFRYAQINFGPVMAMAAKLAVAEVRTILDDPIPHDRVQLPGVFVDRVVAAGK